MRVLQSTRLDHTDESLKLASYLVLGSRSNYFATVRRASPRAVQEVIVLVAEQVAHYRIIEKLGTGGMGEVFLAQDTKLDRKVALKMLPVKSIDDVHARKRLLREAKEI